MAEMPKLLYIIVNDDGDSVPGERNVSGERQQIETRRFPPPRYTRSVLQSTLQLMGCKPRHALKISDRIFDDFSSEIRIKRAKLRRHHSEADACWHGYEIMEKEQVELDRKIADTKDLNGSAQGSRISMPNRKRATVTVSRDKFLDVVCDALAEYQYVGPNQRADLMLACRVREKKTSVTVLLCGTSGCGKSTLSSLLASRLGITTVVSTDSVRHMMRSFVSENENSLLWASTYHAGECLDPVAIAEAKIKKKLAKAPSISLQSLSFQGRSAGVLGLNDSSGSLNTQENKDKRRAAETGTRESNARMLEEEKSEIMSKAGVDIMADGVTNEGTDATVGSKTIVVQGFKAQSEMVIDSLDRLITAWEQKNESVVVEGVHLSLNFVMGLMKDHPSIVPFMVYISNEGKHLERFAVRAKYMTLDPAKNKYVKYIRNIRTIQEYLCKRADKHLVPKVNNTNVDKSIALIHATVFSCLRRRMGGEPLWDQATNTVKVVDQEYKNQYAASSLGSKGMFQLIQRRGSSRHLMALMNIDGSVAKAWPIEADSNGKQVSVSLNGNESGVGTPVYGPLAIGKSEPVNLRFGNFGLSAWLTDTGAASRAVSMNSSGDGQSSRGECEMGSSCPGSSCSSSPKYWEGGYKELTEEVAVSGSDEEPDDDLRELDSDEEAVDSGHELIDEDEGGSVDDQSERSDDDDEYNARDVVDDAFWSEDTWEGENRQDNVTKESEGGDDDICTFPGRMGKSLQPIRYHHRSDSGLLRRLESFPTRLTNSLLLGKQETADFTMSENHSYKRSKSCPNLAIYFMMDGVPRFSEERGRTQEHGNADR